MSIRIIKNYTADDLIIADMGDLTIPANGALDIGGNEYHLTELASSEDLFVAMAQGIEKYQLNDGTRDYGFSEGIELIRKISKPFQTDSIGRTIVRSESRPFGYETVFTGRGDDMVNRKFAEGQVLSYDFSDPTQLADDAPEGYKKINIRWQFMYGVYVKEGTFFYYDLPKGSYCNFYLTCPAGGYYKAKTVDANMVCHETIALATEETRINHWVVHYNLEGTCAVGDELNSEAASDGAVPEYFIWECDYFVPEVEGWENAHGHVALEIFRAFTVHK